MLPRRNDQRTLRLLPAPSQLRQEVESFLIDRRARGLSEKTIDYYREKIMRLVAFVEARGAHRVEEITADALRAFLVEEGTKRSAGGVHGHYRAARCFLRWWDRETEPQGWSNPTSKVAAPRVPEATLDPLNLDDLRKLLATCERRTFTGDRDRALLLSLLDTGSRASEFLSIDVGDLDLQSGAIRLHLTKGKRQRVVFLGRFALRCVSRSLRHRPSAAPGDPLWASQDGRRLHYQGLVSLLRRRAQAAGISAPMPHAFRRAFALGMLRGGADVLSLQRLLGHADLSVLRAYLKLQESDLHAAHLRGSPVDRLLDA